jgi:hypothetical protein
MKANRWIAFSVLSPNERVTIYELDHKGRLVVRPRRNKRRLIPYTDPEEDGQHLARPSVDAIAPVPITVGSAVSTPAAIPSNKGSSGPYTEHAPFEFFPNNSEWVLHGEDEFLAWDDFWFEPKENPGNKTFLTEKIRDLPHDIGLGNHDKKS